MDTPICTKHCQNKIQLLNYRGVMVHAFVPKIFGTGLLVWYTSTEQIHHCFNNCCMIGTSLETSSSLSVGHYELCRDDIGGGIYLEAPIISD